MGKKKSDTSRHLVYSEKLHYGGGKATPIDPKSGSVAGANTSAVFDTAKIEGKSLRQGSAPIQIVVINGSQIDVSIYQPLYANPVALLSSSKGGLYASAAIDFINLSGFTHAEFQTTFKTTVKTIQNYATQQLKLDSVLSEKLLKAFALFERGIGVFGSPQAFHDWLNRPAFGLGSQLPYDLMDTITGIMLIEEELIRLEYGDLA